MTRRSLRSLAGIALLATAICVLAGCGATPEPAATPTAEPAPSSPEPEDTPTPEPEETVDAEPECETIIPADTVADFESIGWSVQGDVFRIAGVEVPGGIQCTWGDYSVASDHVQIFGWAPMTPEQSIAAQGTLIAEGWTREDGEEGVYITEDPDSAISTDEDGYGMTYLFGDGWVTIADTKQSLVLVSWPPA